MLVVETVARIRREHFVKGKTIKEIARDLKVSRNTVRKVLRSGETSFEYERTVQPRPKLGRWAAELDLPASRDQIRYQVYRSHTFDQNEKAAAGQRQIRTMKLRA